jgi:hypothetical protein
MYSYCYVYIVLLLCMLCFVYSVFIVPTGTIRLPWLRVLRAFSSVVRQMAGIYLAKTGHGPHSSQLVNSVVLCNICVECVVLCIVIVYCTTVTGCQPNCSIQIYRYHRRHHHQHHHLHRHWWYSISYTGTPDIMSAIQALLIQYQLHRHSWHNVSYTGTADTVSATMAFLT